MAVLLQVIIGEISNRWSNATTRPTAAGVSMAHIHARAVARGFSGVFSWAWTCEPAAGDLGCVGRDELAAGLRAGAAPPRSRAVDRGSLSAFLPSFGAGGAGGARAAAAAAPSVSRLPGNQEEPASPAWPTASPWIGANASSSSVSSAGYVCGCGSNRPPDRHYACSQQALWGKCQESWMGEGHCLGWCHNCARPHSRAAARARYERNGGGAGAGLTRPTPLSLTLAVMVTLGLGVTAGLAVALGIGIMRTLIVRQDECVLPRGDHAGTGGIRLPLRVGLGVSD